MTGTRYRMVDVQNGHRHVSTVVLGEAEVEDHLYAEAAIHRLGGWMVTEGEGVVVARKPGVERIITAEAFDPHNDNPSEA